MSAPLVPGVGIGWRPEIAGFIAALRGVQFCEVIAESLPIARGRAIVPDELAQLSTTVVPHGISLSLGGAEPVEQARIDRLAACAVALDAPLVSEHIAFVRADGIEAGHLLPVPRTREALDVLSENIRRTQDGLPVPFAVENIAALFDWPDAEYTEAQFLTELTDRTGVLLLLDIANVYANARNHGVDPVAELNRLPLERVAYCHVAGGREIDGRYHDTHTDPVPEEVLDMVRSLTSPKPLLLEVDGNYPPAAQLLDQLDAIADAASLPRITDRMLP
ncbi:DUF692 domain-containing protein [Antrihabitans cavernicola]|uniref:DUF692 domain-containing protein n=1 Tax=Antrihabitans cavernicola TaxID=2495913 RepID=A0A5A7SH96_9NOCA|nr:DUF692 domain-containing protein [Spelaeibacter cavernicola]KAA0025004.1 DUF692 domain-containing protein [Spelaeibacter cavernicola]